MTARNLDVILKANWNSDNVAEPDIEKEPYLSIYIFKRGITVKRMRKIEDFMGIINRGHYDPASHIAWLCKCVSNDQDDCEDMIDEVRRICSQFQPTTTEVLLTWDGGEWSITRMNRFVFDFTVMVRISGKKIAGT